MAGRDPVELAIDHALRVKEAADKLRLGAGSAGQAFARRAEQLPGLMASAGLVAALTFYLSKSKPEKLADATKLLSPSDIKDDELKRLASSLRDELGAGEGAGYTLVTAAVAIAMREIAGVNVNLNSNQPAVEIAKALKNLRCQKGKTIKVHAALQPYLVELKKLASAFFGQ